MSEDSFNANSPLDGLRVVDATDIRGALCARILGDLGADVVRLAADDPEGSVHIFRNANKRRLDLNIHKPKDRQALEEVLEATDVLVENLGPELQAEYGYSDIAERNHHLIHVSISDFGLSGPHSQWRLEPLPAFSASGAHFPSGFADLPPCWLPGFLAHDCASVFGSVAAVAAIMDRRRTDAGQMVEISVQEAGLSGFNPWSIPLRDYHKLFPYLPVLGNRNGDISYWVLKAKDGWVRIVIGSPHQWRAFLQVAGNPKELSGPEWEEMGFRLMNADVARTVIDGLLANRTRDELAEEALKAGATLGILNSPEEFMAHEQTISRGFFTDQENGVQLANPPWNLSRTPVKLRLSAPKPNQKDTGWLDEENIEFCPKNGLMTSSFGSTESSPDELLLSGVRVVEFGMAAVVPELCWLLAEMGADVIKVESLERPDVLRTTGSGEINKCFTFNTECRGRRSVSINMNTERGRELAFELCASADIVTENYRGGVLERWGISYEALSAKNPKLIYVSSQGYGNTGPMKSMPAFGPLNSGFAGSHLIWNHPEAPRPCGAQLNHPDHIAGKLLCAAVLAALDERARTGRGQMVEMAQTEAAAYMIGDIFTQASLTGTTEGAFGNASRHIVPHNTYPASQEDSWVSIVAAGDEEFQNLAKVIGGNDTPAEWADNAGRLKHREDIDAWITNWTKTKSAYEAASVLQAEGVSAMEVQGPDHHHADLHLKERGFIVKLNHKEVGEESHCGNPIKMGRTQLKIAESSPCLGEHTLEVLGEVFGITETEAQKLIEEEICI